MERKPKSWLEVIVERQLNQGAEAPVSAEVVAHVVELRLAKIAGVRKEVDDKFETMHQKFVAELN